MTETSRLPATCPDLHSLELFLTVIRLGSMSRAAAAHGLAQPSAGARLRQLERQMGATLLVRAPSGSVPTAEGLLVARDAEEVLRAAHALVAAAEARKVGHTDRLRVVASYTVAEHVLPGRLKEIRRRFPRLAVEVAVANSAEVLERLRAGRDDLGFIESPGPTPGLTSHEIGSDELVVVVAPSHRWATRRVELAASHLATTPLVLREQGSGTRDALVQALRAAGLPEPSAAVEVGSAAAIVAAVSAGVAPGVLSRLAVDDDVELGRLVIAPVARIDLRRRFRAVWRRQTPLGPAARALAGI